MFFCEYCEIFKNNSFYRTPPEAASTEIHLAVEQLEIKTI